jgi:hypothetical protein
MFLTVSSQEIAAVLISAPDTTDRGIGRQATGPTGADQATLTNLLQADVNGLSELDQRIQADTSAAHARADARTIFTGYRLYALASAAAAVRAAQDQLAQVDTGMSSLDSSLSAADQARNTPDD